MKVLLVSNYLPDNQFSMLGFADCLERELPKHGVSVSRIAPAPPLRRLGWSRNSRKWLAYVDKYILFPRTLRREAANHDIVHILDHGNSMYVPHIADRPHVVTCHDLLAIRAALGELPNWKIGASGQKYQAMILEGLKKSRMIAAVSEATLQEVLRLTHVSADCTRLVYNGPYQSLNELNSEDAVSLLQSLGVNGEFFLHVGVDTPYKNRGGLLEIYEFLLQLLGDRCPDLVLAGRTDSAEVLDRIAGFPTGKVRMLSDVDKQTLCALYQMAEGLLFPSFWEGFGLPILEAQSLGCPVFTSNRQPMTEVGGSAARYFDPEDHKGAAMAIVEGLPDKSRMRAEGRKNAKLFTAERMASEYFHLYVDVLALRSSHAGGH